MWHEVDLPEFRDDSPPGCKKYLSSAICDQQKQFLFEAGEVGETRPRATASVDQRLKFFCASTGHRGQLAQKGGGEKKKTLTFDSQARVEETPSSKALFPQYTHSCH